MEEDSSENKRRANADIILRGLDGEAVTVRDVPVPVMQALYHEITGKTESLAKSYKKSFVINLEAFRQLFYKMEQTLEQFERRGMSTTVVVRHQSEETSRFSSKEKFFQYDTTKTEPITGIDIELDFLLSVPMVGKFHQYKIEIGAVSHVAEKEGLIFGISYGQLPVVFKISYIDYVVARTFLSTFDEWINSLEITEAPKLLGQMVKYDDFVEKFMPPLVGSSSFLLMTSLFFKFGGPEPSIHAVWIWGLASVTAYLIVSGVGDLLARKFIQNTGFFGRAPHILINRGDDKNYKAYLAELKNRPGLIIRCIVGFCGIVLVNAGAAIVVRVISAI